MARPASVSGTITDGVVPKHEQLRQILLRMITEELSPGDMIPGERQLCTEHGVSRITVRAAVGQLVNEGLLVRIHGKGTFVATRTARSRLHLASFNDDMRRLGLTPSTEVLDVERGVPPAATVEALGLRPGEAAIRVRRLRLADGAPMSVDDAWYSAALAPDLDTAPLTGSVYELLRERYDVTIDHAEQTVAATEAGDEYGALLGLDPTRPVLLFDRVSFAGDRRVEHCCSRYRGDRYEIVMAVDGGK
jgi:GntR family transcriptional regulator, N-acetylglucosamine utilization regulator